LERGIDVQGDAARRGIAEQKRSKFISGCRIGAQRIGLSPAFVESVRAAGGARLVKIVPVNAEISANAQRMSAANPTYRGSQAPGVVRLIGTDAVGPKVGVNADGKAWELERGKLVDEGERKAKIRRIEILPE
jgi:hypothetical protein